jgi:hypothetical protein
MIKLELQNGLEAYLRPSYKSYCDGDRVKIFYILNPTKHYYQMRAQRSKEDLVV